MQVEDLDRKPSILPDPNASFKVYLQSIIYMPHSMRMLCLTNLFCWMAHVCYSLYFTDFVGEAVFGGDPTVSNLSYKRLKTELIFSGPCRFTGPKLVRIGRSFRLLGHVDVLFVVRVLLHSDREADPEIRVC